MVPPFLMFRLDAVRSVTKSTPSIPATHRANPAALPGVLLVAHGSARTGASAEPVRATARALAARGFAHVGTGFWKEEPFLHQALDTMRCARVVVLPVFLAEGYFSRVVVPRELGLEYGLTTTGSRQVHLLPPLGTDPDLDDLAVDRARASLPAGARHDEALVVVLGHGTPLQPSSANTVLEVCRRLDRRREFARVAPAFIDQEPQLTGVIGRAAEPFIVVVPFLVAAGFHGGVTVPEELAATSLAGVRTRRGDLPKVAYAEPVGTHPKLIDTVARKILDVSFDKGTARPPAPHPEHPALVALESALAEQVARHGSVTFLEVEIRTQDDAYVLRHRADAGVGGRGLSLRADARALEELACRTSGGSHRPLRTAAGLPTGWQHRARGDRALVEALIALYGPAVVHWHLGEQGQLRPNSFAEVAARQTGIYAALRCVQTTAVAAAIRRCCEGRTCLRTRIWDQSGSPAGRAAGAVAPAPSEGTGLTVPCPSPCPILLSTMTQTDYEDPVNIDSHEGR